MAPGKDNADNNGWDEYKRLILSDREATEKYRTETIRERESFRREVRADNQKLRETLSAEISKINSEIAVLKVKAGLWGSLGGVTAILMALCVWLVQQAWAGTLVK